MARLMIRNVVAGVQDWLLNGFLVLLAVGLLIIARLGQRAGMPIGWRWLSLVISALSLLGVALSFFDVGPFGELLTLLIGGVLAPAWALWLARRATILWPKATGAVVASMSPD